MQVTELYTYPVKSLGGISLDTAELSLTGFQYDRQWMVAQPNGTFMTQRTYPQMALIDTRFENDQLVLSTFGMEDLLVDSPQADSDNRLESDIWGDSVNGIVHADETNQWLSDAIGETCKLLSFPQEDKRQCDMEFSSEGDHTLFADGFPLLVISQESLDDLNSRLSTPVGMNRFRPNIVVSGTTPYAEDDWNVVKVNGIRLRAVKACGRCSVPTVDPKTGMLAGPEPIHTLSGYRTGEDGDVYFGMNLIPDSTGVIRLGDSVNEVG